MYLYCGIDSCALDIFVHGNYFDDDLIDKSDCKNVST